MPDAETLAALLVDVDERFAQRDPALVEWPDPFPGDIPDEAYSRGTNPQRYRIVAARLDAWVDALVDAGLATVETDIRATWGNHYRTPDTVDRLAPTNPAAMGLVIGRSSWEDIEDFTVMLGSDEPVSQELWVPDICCDACDSGSSPLLEALDEVFVAVVTGVFRRLTKGRRRITVDDINNGYSTSNYRGPARSGFGVRVRRLAGWRTVEEVLDDPRGWHEISGESWLG